MIAIVCLENRNKPKSPKKSSLGLIFDEKKSKVANVKKSGNVANYDKKLEIEKVVNLKIEKKNRNIQISKNSEPKKKSKKFFKKESKSHRIFPVKIQAV